MKKKTWASSQVAIVIIIILLIISYIFVDLFITKPELKKEMTDVKIQYNELSTFLDKKIPEIDSTFRLQSTQIDATKKEMVTLKETFKELEK
jgi:hypothetical protein